MKAIVLISQSDEIGGAQVRYLNLFSEISKRKSDYSLIINRSLFAAAIERKILSSDQKNVILIEIPGKKKRAQSISVQSDAIVKTALPKKFRKLRTLRNTLIDLRNFFILSYRLGTIFKIYKPQYVYAVWLGGMLAWPFKYIYKFKLVYSFMDSGFTSIYHGLKYPLKNERLALKHAHVIDFLSAELVKGVEQRVALKPQTIRSVSPCSFKNYNNLRAVYPKKDTVVFAARMGQIKNPMLLLESIKLFNATYIKKDAITFQFLGEGDLMQDMINYVKQNKLSNVELHGQVSDPVNFLRVSKIFVSIQQANNYPSQSVLEAMACENVIIASDVGETRLLVTENEGVLVDLNAGAISDALIYLLQNEIQRDKMAKSARVKVLTEHTIDKYLSYFYSLEDL